MHLSAFYQGAKTLLGHQLYNSCALFLNAYFMYLRDCA